MYVQISIRSSKLRTRRCCRIASGAIYYLCVLRSSHRAPASLLAAQRAVALSSPRPFLKNIVQKKMFVGLIWGLREVTYLRLAPFITFACCDHHTECQQASWQPREQWHWAHQDRFWKISSRKKMFGGLIWGLFDYHLECQRAWPPKDWRWAHHEWFLKKYCS